MSRSPNNFDALRLAAAVAVLVSHAVPLSYGSNAREAVHWFSGEQATLGSMAVAVFFAASGYLITQSWRQRPAVVRFVVARALRLVPALAANLVVLAFVAGPLLTALPLAEYLAHPDVPRFLAKVFMVGFTSDLPGIFTANPRPGVNSALWTLPYEVRCYALVLVLGVLGALNRWTVLAAWMVTAGLVGLGVGEQHTLLASMFLGGAAMQLWRPALDGRAALACVALLVAGLLFGGWRFASSVAGPYAVIYAALALPPVQAPAAGRPDLSYGIYLWAFPVQQVVSLSLGGNASWWANILLSLPPTLALAWASWHWVEAPALKVLRRPGQRGTSPLRAGWEADAPPAGEPLNDGRKAASAA